MKNNLEILNNIKEELAKVDHPPFDPLMIELYGKLIDRVPEEGFELLVADRDISEAEEQALQLLNRYEYVVYTGFRKGELGSLTLRSFRLDQEPCMVTIQAAYSKHRREDAQVMHPDLVEKFKEWMSRKTVGPNEILFPISRKTCGTERDGATFLTFDLGAARTFWIAESETEEEEKRREESDFLAYRNFDGKYADFHSLRYTFITNLGRAKVSPKTAQALARHSDISLTMNIYTHVAEDEQIAAINSLSCIPKLKKTEE